MKVQRERAVRKDSDTHTITITLTAADVKDVFVQVRLLFNKSVSMEYNPFFTKEVFLENIRKHFSYLGEYRKEIQEWAFNVALRYEFVQQTGEGMFRINPKIMTMRTGKTPQEVIDFLEN